MSTEFEEELSAEEIRAYWTPERRAAAKPRVGTPEIMPKPDAEFLGPTGEPKEIPGYNPTPSAEASEIGSPLTMSPVTTPAEWPFCTVGKLYFIWNGQACGGSACVISNNTLLTAAHNIVNTPDDGRTWIPSRIRLFIPALLADGTQPFDNWAAKTSYTMGEWTEKPKNWGYDVGIIHLGNGGARGKSISSVVGYVGRKYNLPLFSKPTWLAVGYPGENDTMYEEPGIFIRTLDSNRTVCRTGSMGEGSSGGPWFTNKYLVNGIESTGFPDANASSSVYFNDDIEDFIEGTLA
jgi:V8-like Glu-specific endopeptidase